MNQRRNRASPATMLSLVALVACGPKPTPPAAPVAAPPVVAPPVPAPTPAPAPAAPPEIAAPPDAELVYFIMVDRFFNGDPSNDATVDRSDPHAFHGGDLAGIRQKLDYLSDLGVTTLWLSPVFGMRTEKVGEWGAFHGYWVKDLTQVEPRFGTADELRELSRDLHRRDMKLVLDMVWNHTDYEAPLRSEHPDWYHQRGDIEDWDDPVAVVQGDVHGLPDLAQEKPEVAAFLRQESLAWVDKADADGFRVDAVRHMPLDFLADMNAALDDKRPGFWTVGEDFNGDATALARTLDEGGFDAVFDFPLRYAMVDTFCKDAPMGRLAGVLSADRLVGAPDRLVTFLDNHDVPRILHECGGEGWRVDAAFTFLMNVRGTPSLTWGTELGLDGGEEPDNRRDMPWGRLGALQGDRRAGVRRAMAVRRDTAAARIGASRVLTIEPDRMVLAQVLPTEAVVLRVWRGAPTTAPSLPAWATAEGVARGETTRQSGGPATSADGAGLHVHVDRLRWSGEGASPWDALVSPPEPRTVQVTVRAAPPGDLRLVGAPPELGGWDPGEAPRLTRADDGSAQGEVRLPAGEVAPLKLVVVDDQGEPSWEPRPDRTLHVSQGEPLTTVEYDWGR